MTREAFGELTDSISLTTNTSRPFTRRLGCGQRRPSLRWLPSMGLKRLNVGICRRATFGLYGGRCNNNSSVLNVG
jgi:hypothetical protein